MSLSRELTEKGLKKSSLWFLQEGRKQEEQVKQV